MKKIILLYITGLVSSLAFSQKVGINTDDPKGVFHVAADDKTNNVIVDSEGNLKVGGDISIPPDTKVHVEVKGDKDVFRLSDKSEGQGYLLMSKDDKGTATWIPRSFSVIEGKPKTILKDINGNDKYLAKGGGNEDITEDSLKLPPGIWMIMAKYGVQGDSDGLYYWTYLHDLDDEEGDFYDETCPGKRTEGKDNNFSNCNYKVYKDSNGNDKFYNPNWYLERTTSFQNALTVAGMLPEQGGGAYSTPTLNYIAEIRSDNKKPGDTGYEHELRLTFSTTAEKNNKLVPGIGNNFEFGVYFFALRLDILGDTP
jgi:hypothetical protein